MIDVIIPYYNTNSEIRDCICRTISCFNMHKENFKIILVCDGSNDEKLVKEAVNKLNYNNIQFLSYSENKGPGKAKNYGIEHTSGDYLIFWDADDLLTDSDWVNDYDLNTNVLKINLDHKASYVYRRNIIDKYNLRFHELYFEEDTLFLREYIELISKEKIESTENICGIYNYVYNENHLCAKTTEKVMLLSRLVLHVLFMLDMKYYINNCKNTDERIQEVNWLITDKCTIDYYINSCKCIEKAITRLK